MFGGFGLPEVTEAKLDEGFARDIRWQRASPQPLANRIGQRRPATGRAGTGLAEDVRTTSIELKGERTSLVVAQCPLVELAKHVTRDVDDDLPDDSIVDASRPARRSEERRVGKECRSRGSAEH